MAGAVCSEGSPVLVRIYTYNILSLPKHFLMRNMTGQRYYNIIYNIR